jgi:hypothetical protein
MLSYSIYVFAKEINIVDLDQKRISNPFSFSRPCFTPTFANVYFLFILCKSLHLSIHLIMVFETSLCPFSLTINDLRATSQERVCIST